MCIRDSVEIFPVLNAMFQRIQGSSPYRSPTDMGVNMAGFAIVDDGACREASRMEILRRYYAGMVDRVRGKADDSVVRKLEIVMQQADVTPDICPAVAASLQVAESAGMPAGAMVLPDGRIVTGKNSSLLGPSAALLMNAIKALAGIDKDLDLLPASIIAPISDMKISHLGHHNPRLHSDEVLIALSISAVTNPCLLYTSDWSRRRPAAWRSPWPRRCCPSRRTAGRPPAAGGSFSTSPESAWWGSSFMGCTV